MYGLNAAPFIPPFTRFISTIRLRPRWLRERSRRKEHMAYSVRHITKFGYEPAVRESVMEVRMQPRTDARQRCMTFSLGVLPQATVMVYRDFFGNVVHHFDIPGRTNVIEVDAHAIVDVVPPAEATPETSWEDIDAQVGKGDYWEMLLPSHFAKPTDLLEKLAGTLRVERRGTPFELLLE